MKIAVCIKQTPDTTTRVQIADDGTSIEEEGIQWIVSPYDEFAFRVSDGKEFSTESYLMTIDVNPINDPPQVLAPISFPNPAFLK